MSSRHQALEALIVDRQDPAAMVAPGWYRVIRTVDLGLDPLDETGVPVPADGITGPDATRRPGCRE